MCMCMCMKIGHLQKKLIELGLQKGFLTPIDFGIMYKQQARSELERWILLGWLRKEKEGNYKLTEEAKKQI